MSIDYKKCDKIIDNLLDGSHVFAGEIAEYLIKNNTTSVKETKYISEIMNCSHSKLRTEIKARMV